MKTDEEIAKEKEAVQKMVGAKGAMETALNRIQRLERELSSVCNIMEEIAKAIGDNTLYRTYSHGEAGNEARAVSVANNLRRFVASARAIL